MPGADLLVQNVKPQMPIAKCQVLSAKCHCQVLPSDENKSHPSYAPRWVLQVIRKASSVTRRASSVLLENEQVKM